MSLDRKELFNQKRKTIFQIKSISLKTACLMNMTKEKSTNNAKYIADYTLVKISSF